MPSGPRSKQPKRASARTFISLTFSLTALLTSRRQKQQRNGSNALCLKVREGFKSERLSRIVWSEALSGLGASRTCLGAKCSHVTSRRGQGAPQRTFRSAGRLVYWNELAREDVRKEPLGSSVRLLWAKRTLDSAIGKSGIARKASSAQIGRESIPYFQLRCIICISPPKTPTRCK